jgi:hypothetical protein
MSKYELPIASPVVGSLSYAEAVREPPDPAVPSAVAATVTGATPTVVGDSLMADAAAVPEVGTVRPELAVLDGATWSGTTALAITEGPKPPALTAATAKV